MNGRFAGVVLAVLVAAASIRGLQLGANAASDQSRKTPEETAHHHEKLRITPSSDAQQLEEQVAKARAKAVKDGYYACCIEPACSWCMLHMGKCTCGLGVGTGKWTCRECHGGWEAGQGRIPGKRREDVQKMKTLTVDERIRARLPEASTPVAASKASSDGNSASADARTVADGAKLYRSFNCQSCHKLGNAGGGVGPDLTHETQRHADIVWQITHLQHPDQVHPGSAMPSFANLKPQELKALTAFLVMQK
jgi:cytochrome c2